MGVKKQREQEKGEAMGAFKEGKGETVWVGRKMKCPCKSLQVLACVFLIVNWLASMYMMKVANVGQPEARRGLYTLGELPRYVKIMIS